ncbi:MAG: hypothetical protein IJA12_00365 [Oscillospiraceae bacterium]|nr:hypothetical protein [Oscillospiraceae bacterium]
MNEARDTYFKLLQKKAETDNRIMFVLADCAGFVFEEFRKKYPDKIVNVGIAEQNAIAVACGLSLAGKIPIVYGHSPFILTRTLDQIKSAIGIMNLPVSIVVNGVGFSQPWFGPTHFNMDDISLMSSVANMKIITPSDMSLSEFAAHLTIMAESPLYLRFDGRYSANILSSVSKSDFSDGFRIIKKGTSAAVISHGNCVSRIIPLVEKIEKEKGIEIAVIDVFSVPYNDGKLYEAIGDSPVLAIEEHIENGSIGQMFATYIKVNNKPNKVKLMNIDYNGRYPACVSADINWFYKSYKFTDNDIISNIKQMTER